MQVYYMNDEKEEITVKIMDDTFDPTYTKSDNSHTYHRLKPCEARVFDIVCPEGSVLYVKKWIGMVMLSYLDQSALEQLSQCFVEPQHKASES